MINNQSALRIASDLCKNVSLTVLICSNGNSYTISTQSYRLCVHTVYTYSSQYGDTGRAKEIKINWDSRECRVPFWARVPYIWQHWPREHNAVTTTKSMHEWAVSLAYTSVVIYIYCVRVLPFFFPPEKLQLRICTFFPVMIRGHLSFLRRHSLNCVG